MDPNIPRQNKIISGDMMGQLMSQIDIFQNLQQMNYQSQMMTQNQIQSQILPQIDQNQLESKTNN